MKHLTTLLTMAITLTGLAQQMPYNPDANGDDFVGVDDVLGVLGVYDTALMQPDLQCDYEGTDLEQLLGGLFDQALVLDSLYVEYLRVDSVPTYLPGCPDVTYIETILERSYMLEDVHFVDGTFEDKIRGYVGYLGYTRGFEWKFSPTNGLYTLELLDEEQAELFNTSGTSYWNVSGYVNIQLPLPETWGIDEDGFQIDWSGWITNCDHFRVLPYWSGAE